MKITAEKVFSLLFMLILLLPVFTMNVQENVVSEIDNRTLAEVPTFGQKGFTQAFEAYLSDRIGGRTQMVTAYQNLNRHLFHEMVHPTYTYGKDGYVFFKMHNNIQYGDFHKAFADMVIKIKVYCNARNVPFYFLFSPEKISVYRQHLPKGVVYEDDWVTQLIATLEEAGVVCVNNAEYLKEQSQQSQVFNQVYDAGHWNDCGCFMGMNHLFSKMHQQFPAVRELTEDDFNISKKLETSLPASKFPISEEVPVFALKQGYADLTDTLRAEVEVDKRYPHLHYYLNNAPDAGQLPKVLIFQGSYLNGRPQFLLSNTSVDIGVHNYQNILNFSYWFNLVNPDAVIFEIAEYTFANQYFDYEKMKQFTLSPVLSPSTALQWSETTPELPLKTDVCLIKGSATDTLTVKRRFSDAHWAWLYTNGRTLEMSRNADGFLSVKVLHGAVKLDPDALLFIRDSSGSDYHFRVRIRSSLIDPAEATLTPGTSSNDTAGFVFTTQKEGNRFDRVCFMVHNLANNNYTVFCSGNTPGKVTDSYTHTQESGMYEVIVKGNTNLADERATFRVYLEQGETYFANFTLDSFAEQHAEISHVRFY